MLTDQQTLTGHLLINLREFRSQFIYFLLEVRALGCCTLPQSVAEHDIDRSNGGCASESASTCCRRVHEWIWVHHWFEDFLRCCHSTYRHNTATERFSGRDNIGFNIPMIYSP